MARLEPRLDERNRAHRWRGRPPAATMHAMIDIDIPGFASLRLGHLVLDYNGTIAGGGELLEGVVERIERLAERLEVHVVTADTRGRARGALAGLPVSLHLLPAGGEAEAKRDYVRALGASKVVSMGNGRNDALMLTESALGIAVLGPEGLAADAAGVAHLLAPGIAIALDLLLDPLRLVATLRR